MYVMVLFQVLTFTGTFTLGVPVVRDRGGLFAPLEEENISSVDLDLPIF